MEALRDRTVKIDVPYVTRLKDEVKIYEKDFNVEKVKGKHIAPHTIEVAAMWAVLTRLTPPKHANLTLLQKLKLYNGMTLPGFTEDNVIELKREASAEGMTGISPRYIQDKIDIPDGRKDDFRREIMNYIGALAIDGKKFDYKTNERLQKALELKLFEDQKDTIKLTSLVSNVVDKATQEKIDVVKSRLIRNYGYNESSATDVLTFVASIFARGHTKK